MERRQAGRGVARTDRQVVAPSEGCCMSVCIYMRSAMSHSPFPRALWSRGGSWGREQPALGGVSDRAVRLPSAGVLARVRALLMTLGYTTQHRHRVRDALTVKVSAGRLAPHTYTRTLLHTRILAILLLLLPVLSCVCVFIIVRFMTIIFLFFFFLNAFCQRILLLLLPFDVRVHKNTNNYYTTY